MYQWHGKTYLAAAHGISGILYILMSVPGLLSSDAVRKDIQQSIDFIMTLPFRSGNYPTRGKE